MLTTRLDATAVNSIKIEIAIHGHSLTTIRESS
jgi:hypothetical protein